MKSNAVKGLELAVESVNYVVIQYALSNMAMLFRSNVLFVLFFASEIWMMNRYWQRAREVTGSRAVSAVLLMACFALHVALVYFSGRVVGNAVPFIRG